MNIFQVKIGRSNDNEMRIPDISVSRTHAIIKREGKRIFITDNGSKFGTLVQLKQPL